MNELKVIEYVDYVGMKMGDKRHGREFAEAVIPFWSFLPNKLIYSTCS